MINISAKVDGDKLKFRRGKDEVESLNVDNFVLITSTKDGAFSVDSNGLKVQDLIGHLEVALIQARQDFIAKNYGQMVLKPGEGQ